MLFRKKMEPRCAYCAKGRKIGEDQVACVRRGIMAPEDSCGSFTYDPLRRIPPRPLKVTTDRLKQEDFEL